MAIFYKLQRLINWLLYKIGGRTNKTQTDHQLKLLRFMLGIQHG